MANYECFYVSELAFNDAMNHSPIDRHSLNGAVKCSLLHVLGTTTTDCMLRAIILVHNERVRKKDRHIGEKIGYFHFCFK